MEKYTFPRKDVKDNAVQYCTQYKFGEEIQTEIAAQHANEQLQFDIQLLLYTLMS